MPKKHNLSFLLQQMKNIVDIDEKYYDYADALTPYGIAVRYPNELYIEERNVKEAIRYAEEFVCWAEVIDADTNCQLYVEVTTLKVL